MLIQQFSNSYNLGLSYSGTVQAIWPEFKYALFIVGAYSYFCRWEMDELDWWKFLLPWSFDLQYGVKCICHVSPKNILLWIPASVLWYCNFFVLERIGEPVNCLVNLCVSRLLTRRVPLMVGTPTAVVLFDTMCC